MAAFSWFILSFSVNNDTFFLSSLKKWFLIMVRVKKHSFNEQIMKTKSPSYLEPAEAWGQQFLFCGHIIPEILCVGIHSKSLQSCLTLCNPLDCSPPGSSVHGILHARTLEERFHPLGHGQRTPRDLSDPGIKLESLTSPALTGSLH